MAYRHSLNYWQLAPALDLQDLKNSPSNVPNYKPNEPFHSYKNKLAARQKPPEKGETFDCLIVGVGHACLAKTLSRVIRHNPTKVKIYIVEKRPEMLVRHLLLLSAIANENSAYGFQERAEIYLEVFGNCHVRASTHDFIVETSSKLLENIATSRGNALPVASLCYLKQKEMDAIGSVLSFLKDKHKSFDVGKAWDEVQRSYFGSRYDCRKNLYDYDFCMRLKDFSIINLRKYIHWRETGDAFKFREARFVYPNKTLCSFSGSEVGSNSFSDGSRSSLKVEDRYAGDFTTSPYLAFGVECEDENYMEKANNAYVKSSEDISKFNVVDIVEEYASLSTLAPEKKRRVYGVFIDTLCKTRWRFEKCFDVAYFSYDMINYIGSLIPHTLKEDGIVVIEAIDNVVDLTQSVKDKFFEAVQKVTEAKNLKKESDISNGFYSMFTLNKTA